jgi:hypothetical protein
MKKSLPKSIRIFRLILYLMRRVQIYLENKTDCPGLKDDLAESIKEIELYISIE